MARTKGTVVENNFIGGLNTEANALAFPPNACTETYNCVFDEFGRVSRRPELDIEKDAQYSSGTEYASTQAFTEYLWVNAGGTGLINLYVVQVGSFLFFYDVSNSTNLSNNQVLDFIALDGFKATDTIYDPRDEPCQFSNSQGFLIVTNRACDPILVTFDPEAASNASILGTRISIKYRDFVGIESPYGPKERPTFSLAGLAADNTGVKHYYNLLNQGWHVGPISGGLPAAATSALGLWDTALPSMPSNSDYVGYYRLSDTVPFDVNRVDVNSGGNTLAPKGHFILSLSGTPRRDAMVADGYSLSYTATSATYVPAATGTVIGAGANAGTDYDKLFNEDASTGIAESTTSTTTGTKSLAFFGGKDYGGSPKAVFKAVIKPWANSYGNAQKTGAFPGYVSQTITYELRGHSSAPSSGSEGTLLGSTSFVVNSGAAQSQKTITSSDQSTTFRYVWIRATSSFSLTESGVTHTYALYLGDIYIYEAETFTGDGELPGEDISFERPSTCAFYAGRAWYAGIDATNLSTNIFYSQIVESTAEYGKCYQVNDPTSEQNAAVLPSDGGVVKIPEIGKIVKLYAQQSSLLVFATNGVWVIGGSGYGSTFEPTNYVVKRISSQGTQSPQSFIDVKGLPMWWGEDGIFQMDYNPQFDSFNVKVISIEKIQTFFSVIPARNRSKAKGAYDSYNDVAYWLYRNEDIADVEVPNEYDSVLLFNTRSGAFYPWTFDIEDATQQIRGIGYVSDAVGFDPSAIKFTIGIPVSASIQRITFADTYKEVKEYTDFIDFSEGIYGISTDDKDFESYFVTGYRLDAEAIKFFQSMYVMLYLKVETDSGAYLQGIWDFANTGQSGDWSVRQQSSKQQVYNLDNVQRDFHARRLKIRGRGRALQFRVTSQTGKPFTIIGWSNAQSGNADV